jgi:TrmH family RNA methyltransferase
VRPLSAARDLQRRRARERTGLFTAEGVRCVEELLASPLAVSGIIVSPSLRATARGCALEEAARRAAAEHRFEVTEASDSELAAVSDTDTPQGILAIARQPERSFESIPAGRIVLLLDAIQDPGNVGTILRTATAFGVAATIALPGTVDLWNPKLVRSAMGALFSHHAFHAPAADAIGYLRSNRIPLWATAMTGDAVTAQSGGGRMAIVVGNEAGGVSAELLAASARTVAIPIQGVESLNVAVATGIILYAVTTA